MQARVQYAQLADSPEKPELPALGLQLQPEAGEDVDHEGAKKKPLRKRVSLVSRDSATHQARGGFQRAVPSRERGRVPARGRAAVRVLARRPADWDVPVQVPADAPDPDVQGLEAPGVLPVQHRAGGEGPGGWFLGADVAGVAFLSSGDRAFVGAVVGEPACQAVRRAPLQGRGENGDEAAH